MILINKILTQQNLDNTYSFSNELDYLVHLGKYNFYFKFDLYCCKAVDFKVFQIYTLILQN